MKTKYPRAAQRKAPEMDPLTAARIKANTIISMYGDPEQQKERLVSEIISAFENPEKWPMTDLDRCAFLRQLYTNAKRVRSTQSAHAALGH